jgi:hypothetical protein
VANHNSITKAVAEEAYGYLLRVKVGDETLLEEIAHNSATAAPMAREFVLGSKRAAPNFDDQERAVKLRKLKSDYAIDRKKQLIELQACAKKAQDEDDARALEAEARAQTIREEERARFERHQAEREARAKAAAEDDLRYASLQEQRRAEAEHRQREYQKQAQADVAAGLLTWADIQADVAAGLLTWADIDAQKPRQVIRKCLSGILCDLGFADLTRHNYPFARNIKKAYLEGKLEGKPPTDWVDGFAHVKGEIIFYVEDQQSLVKLCSELRAELNAPATGQRLLQFSV